jgi:hypothetical protein
MSSDPGAAPHRVQVGQLYSPTRTSWPETPHLRLSPASCDLALFLSEPTEDEVREVSAGPAAFAWADGGPVSVLCFKFGALSWMDTPFEPWQVADDERGVPLGDPSQYLLLQVTLVEAGTGIVRAMRAAAWPPDFAEQVRETLRRQLAAPADHGAAARRVAAMYQHSSEELAEQSPVHCIVPQLVFDSPEREDSPPGADDGSSP